MSKIPETHMLEEKNQLQEVILRSTCDCGTGTPLTTNTQYINKLTEEKGD